MFKQLVRSTKNFVWADQIQRLQPVVSKKDHSVRLHPSIVMLAVNGVNDTYATIYATPAIYCKTTVRPTKECAPSRRESAQCACSRTRNVGHLQPTSSNGDFVDTQTRAGRMGVWLTGS